MTLIVSDESGIAVTPVGGDGAEERENIVEVMESQNNSWRIMSRSTCGMYSTRKKKLNKSTATVRYYCSRVTVPAMVLNGTLKALNSTSKVLQRY